MKRKLLAIFLIIALVFNMLPISVFAEEVSGADQIQPIIAETDQLPLEDLFEAENGYVEDIQALIKAGISGIINFDISGLVSWGVDTFFGLLFPPKPDPTPEQLNQIINLLKEGLQKMDGIQDSLNKVQTQMTLQTLYNILDDFSLTTKNLQHSILILTKKNLDSADSEPDETKRANARKYFLTTSIGINDSNKSSVNVVPFDKDYMSFYDSLTTKHHVATGSGTINTDIFGIYREAMRYNCHWEHQAYDAMDNFNNGVMSTFISCAMLRIASLEARIEMCKSAGDDTGVIGLQNAIELTKENVKEVNELYEEHAVKRTNDTRHLWTPGHERYYRTQAYQPQVFEELCVIPDKAGFSIFDTTRTNREKIVTFCHNPENKCDAGWQWSGTWGLQGKARQPIWLSLFPSTDTDQSLNIEEVNNLLKAYDNKTSLGDILKEGGFTNLPEKDGYLLLYERYGGDEKYLTPKCPTYAVEQEYNPNLEHPVAAYITPFDLCFPLWQSKSFDQWDVSSGYYRFAPYTYLWVDCENPTMEYSYVNTVFKNASAFAKSPVVIQLSGSPKASDQSDANNENQLKKNNPSTGINMDHTDNTNIAIIALFAMALSVMIVFVIKRKTDR